ncbi:MAG: cupin domain-containing protein [Acidobacteria bacterium]|nr:cupin domain-containing protein [Acidobacteriota bacterium]
MKLHNWNQIAVEVMNPEFQRRVVHTDRMTIARLELKKGGVVPLHHHENEQVSIVFSGLLKFLSEGREILVAAGETLQIPSNVPHRVEVLEDSVVMDLFAPPRADWLSGNDAYLRHSPPQGT